MAVSKTKTYLIEFDKQELMTLVGVLDKNIKELEKQSRATHSLPDGEKIPLYARIQDIIKSTDVLAIRISNLLRDVYSEYPQTNKQPE